MTGSGLERCVLLLAVVTVLGCEVPHFGSPSRVDSLRVLGLSVSDQMVEPGQTVVLDALWVDSEPTEEGDIVSAWFPGCANPEWGAVESCIDDLNELRAAEGEDWPHEFAPLPGDRVEVEVPHDILAGREDYGIQYYFYAVCRGSRFVFQPSKHNVVPVVCVDSRGETVSPPDFRLGFRTVTAIPFSEGVSTAIPVIVGFDIDGTAHPPDCIGGECRGYQEPHCEDDSCPRLDISTQCDEETECDGTPFRVLVDESSIGVDWLESVDNLMSVEVSARYFVTDGRVAPNFDLLHEREPFGENERWDRESESTLHKSSGPLFLWAVVYDSLGGVSWAGIQVRAIEPE